MRQRRMVVKAKVAVVVMMVMMVVVVTSSSVGDDPSLFTGCLVSPTLNISVVRHPPTRVEFWGFVGSAGGGPVMEMEVGAAGGFRQTRVNLTHTHGTACSVNLMGERQHKWSVTGRVSAGWRRFLLEVVWREGDLRLALTDDHGTAWLAEAPPVSATQWVRLVVPHFNTTCHALTPMWRVEDGANTEVPLPPLPRRLQFTVVGGAQVRLALQPTKLILATVADGGGGQDVPSPAGPLVLHLTLEEKETNAPPRLAAVGVSGVLEVTVSVPVAALLLSVEGEGVFHVVQQLHVFPATQDTLGGAATSQQVTTLSWPVLAGTAAALLLAGVVVGAGVCRLMTCAAVAAVETTAKPQPRVDAASQKSESPYLEPLQRPSPQPLPSLLEALPRSPARGPQRRGSAAVVIAPCKSMPLYLQPLSCPRSGPRPGPRPGPWPTLSQPPLLSSSPEAVYEAWDEATVRGSATYSVTSDEYDYDYDGVHIYQN